MNIAKKIKTNVVVDSILTIIIGVLFILMPTGSNTVLVNIIGVAVFCVGIVDIVYYIRSKVKVLLWSGDLLAGILKCILGIFTITHTGFMLLIISYAFSIYLIIDGIHSLEQGIELAKASVSGWLLHIVFSILIILCGATLLFQPFSALQTAGIWLGISLLADGLVSLVTVHRLTKATKPIREALKTVRNEIDGNIIEMDTDGNIV